MATLAEVAPVKKTHRLTPVPADKALRDAENARPLKYTEVKSQAAAELRPHPELAGRRFEVA